MIASLPLALLALFQAAPAADAAHASSKIDLRVLVTGVPNTDRLADFETFLGEHFAHVGTASYTDFKPSDADDFDVVIFDGEINPTEKSLGLPQSPTLPADFRRASVLIAGPGVKAIKRLDTKIDWL